MYLRSPRLGQRRWTRLWLFVIGFLLSGCATPPTVWKASALAQYSSSTVRLLDANKETVATVDVVTIRKLVEVKERIENAAGIGRAELLIAGGDGPNAFAATNREGRVVAINIGMLRLLGMDWDAFAAIIGHEFAHHALNHGAQRQQRENVRQGAAVALGIALGAAGVPMSGTIADLGTTAVTTVYTREEEREADRVGLEYASRAGYDPRGAARAWQRMMSVTNFSIPFLSTHPTSQERLDTMKRLAAGETPVRVSPTPSAREQSDIAQKPSGNLEKQFAAAREANDRNPENNAIAVAKGSSRWVWGTSWSAGTENRAKGLALDYCKKQAIKEGITEPCRVYSVNGRVVYDDAQ